MSAEETVTVNPDGSTTFEGGNDGSTEPPVEDPTTEGIFDEETMATAPKGTDPAIYLLLLAILLGFLYYLYLRKVRQDSEDDFFSNLDGEKVGHFCCFMYSFLTTKVHLLPPANLS